MPDPHSRQLGLDANPWAAADVAGILRALCEVPPGSFPGSPQGAADATPAGQAFVSDGAGGTLDRAAFWRLACGVSHAVAAAPGGTDAAIALLAPPGAPGQAWIVGALMAGRPVALLDAGDPPGRNAEVCDALGLRAGLAAPGAALPPGLLALPAPQPADTPAPAAAGPDAPSIIVPTSGSTGRPKGIVHGRRALLFRIRQLAAEFGFGPADLYLSTAASASISGLVHGLAAILSGARLLRADPARLGLAGVLRAAAEAGGATALQGLPGMLCALLAAPGAAAALGGVRRCQSSGAQLLAADVQALRAALPASCQLVNVYGLTEAPALLRWEVPPGWVPEGARVPAGAALDGHRVTVCDEDGVPLPSGEVGELVATGPYLALGEWLGGQLTAAAGRIAPAPGRPGERVLRSGDLARIRPDGLFEIVGRADRQVKIGGRRVELEEIEDQLRRAPGVAAAAAVADRDAPGGARVYAAAVAAPDAPPALPEALARVLRAALPGHMQPSRLVVMPALPLLPGGKVHAAALLERFRALPPPGAESSEVVDPRVERAWRAALGRRPAPGESFRDAGGDSLGLLRLVLELERLTGHPSPHDLLHEGMGAAEMSRALAAPPPAPRGGPRVLLLPGAGGDSEPLARLRDGCPGVEFVVARYLPWRDFARGGAAVELDAAAVLPQAMAAFPGDVPPILVGYSYGGAVAHALAPLLVARGRPARAMLLLDAWPFGRAGGAGGGGGTATIGEAPTETAAEWVQRALRWRMRQAGATPRGARWAARLLPARPPPGRTALRLWSELELSLRESAMRRWAERAPQRAAVPATLFLSRQPRPGAPADLGWAARCDLQAVVPVEGDHVEMLRPPHRAALCAALSAAVRVAALPEAATPEGTGRGGTGGGELSRMPVAAA